GAVNIDSIDVSGYGALRIDVSGKEGDKFIIQLLDSSILDDSWIGRSQVYTLTGDSQVIEIPLSEFDERIDLTDIRRIAIHYGEKAWNTALNPQGAYLTVNSISFLPKDSDSSETPEPSAAVSAGFLEVLGWEFSRKRKGKNGRKNRISFRNLLTPEEQSAANRLAAQPDPLSAGANRLDELQSYQAALGIIRYIDTVSLEDCGTVELEAVLNKFSIYFYQTRGRSPPNATVDPKNNRIIVFANSPDELTAELLAKILTHEAIEYTLINTYNFTQGEAHNKAEEISSSETLFILPGKKALALVPEKEADGINKKKVFDYLAQTFEEGVFVTADEIRDRMPFELRMDVSYQEMMVILRELCREDALKYFTKGGRTGYLLVDLGIFPKTSPVGEKIWGTLFYTGGVMGIADLLTSGHWSFLPRNVRNQYLKTTYAGLSLGEQAAVDIFIEVYVKMARTTLPHIYNKLPEYLRERYEDDFIDTLLTPAGLTKLWQARCKINGISVNTPMERDFISSFAKLTLRSREVKEIFSRLNSGFYGLRKNVRRVATYQHRNKLVASLEKRMFETIIGLLKIQFGQGIDAVEMRIPLDQVKKNGFYEKMIIFYTETLTMAYEPLYASQPTFALYHSTELLRQSLFGREDFLAGEKSRANEAALRIFPRLYNAFAHILGWNIPGEMEGADDLKEEYLKNYIGNIAAEAKILYSNYSFYGELPEYMLEALRGIDYEKAEELLPRLLLYHQSLERLAIICAAANAMDMGDPSFQSEAAREGFNEEAWLLHKVEEIVVRGFQKNHLDSFFGVLFSGLSILLKMESSPEGIKDASRPRVILLTDNAGETVLVMLLVKFLLEMGFNITVASRDTPVINDMTADDTKGLISRLRDMGYFSGYGDLRLEAISSGARVFATPVATLSRDFLSRFRDDNTFCVIAMGQGNAESLWQMQVNKPFVHILMAKSPERIKEFVGIPKHSAMLVVNLPLPAGDLLEGTDFPREYVCLVERQDLVAVLNELGVTVVNGRNIYLYSGEFENIGRFVKCFDAKGITLDAAEGPIYLGQAEFGQDVTVKSTGGVVIRGGAVIGSGAYIENSSIIGVSIAAGEKVIRRRAEIVNGAPIRFRHSGADNLLQSQSPSGGDISALSINKPLLCELLNRGVRVMGNPESIYIAQDAQIGKGSRIYSDVVVSGDTVIGEKAEIGPRAFIGNTKVSSGARIVNSKLENCLIFSGAEVEGVELENEEVYPYEGAALSGRQVSGFIVDPALSRGVNGILSVRARRPGAGDLYRLIPERAECLLGKIREEYPLWYEALLSQVVESIYAARDLLSALKEDRSISVELADRIYDTIGTVLEKGILDNLTMAQAKGVIWQIIWLYAKSPFQLRKKSADKEAFAAAKYLIGILDSCVSENPDEYEAKRLKLAMQFVALSNLNVFDRSRAIKDSDKLTLAPAKFESVLEKATCSQDAGSILSFINGSGYFSADNSDVIIERLLSLPEEDRRARSIIFNVDNAGETVYSLVLIRELLRLGYRVVISANPKPIDDNYDLQDLQGLLTDPEVNNSGFVGDYLKEDRIRVISNGSVNTGLDLAQVSRDFYEAATDKNTVMMFSVGYAVAKNIMGRDLPLPAVSLFWGKDTKIMQAEGLNIGRGDAAVIFTGRIGSAENPAPEGFDNRCYPLAVPLDERLKAEGAYGVNMNVGEALISGLNLGTSGSMPADYREILQERMIWLRQLLGRAPPELAYLSLVVSTNLDLTEGNAASCDISRRIVYLHPYFFNLSENKQVEILYHELISHIARGIYDEEQALEDTRNFAADLNLIPEAISGLTDNIRSRSEKREAISFTAKIGELEDSGKRIISSWKGNNIFKAVFNRALCDILKDMEEGRLPLNRGVTEVCEYLIDRNNFLSGAEIFGPSLTVVSPGEEAGLRKLICDVYGCRGFELKRDVFPDGEIRMVVTDKRPLEGRNVLLLQGLSSDEDFVELILAIGGLRDAGVKEIACIFPESVLDNYVLLDIISPYAKIYVMIGDLPLEEGIFIPETLISCYSPSPRGKSLVRKKKFEQILFIENDPLKDKVSKGLMKFDSSHGLQIGTIKAKTLQEGDVCVDISVDVRGKDCLFIHSTRTSRGIVELLAVLEELKNSGAGDIHVLFFFFAYDRQEKNFPAPLYGPDAFSVNAAKMLMSLVSQYCGRIYTVNTHFIKEPRINAYRLEGVESLEIVNLNAFPYLASYFADKYKLNDPVLVAPDQGTSSFLRLLAESLDYPLGIFKKTRLSAREVDFTEPEYLNVAGRDVILLDDVISGGSTAVKLSYILKDKYGASRVFLGTVHGKQSEESLRVFNSLTDRQGLPLINDIISTDTIASSSNRVSVSEVIVEFLREHLVTAEALDGIDTPSITLILPYRLAGAGDVVFMVNTAQKLKQIYPSLPIKVIYLKNDDYLFLGKIKLVSGFEGQRNIQRLGGVTYINARDSRDRMEEFTGAKDLVMLYAVYPDEYSGSDSYFFETIGLKRAVKITMHELGRELPWRDPNKSGHYLLGCNKDALGMPPVAPNFESYVKYCDAKGREGVYLERRKILGKIPGYSVLNVSETIRSDWGFIYGHLPYEVEMYFKAFDRARREDQDFAARPATIFVNRSQGDNKLREEVFKAAEAGDYSVLEYSHERGRLETVLSGGSNVRIVINTVVPRKLFGQLFTLSNDLPSVVTGQDNLSNILFLNAQTKGRVFFWEVLVFQALAEFDLKRAAEKILSGEEYSVFKEALKRGRDINYDFLYKFFSEHDKYRRIYHKLGEGIGREFSFARRINAVIEDWNEKINPKTYPARLAGELIDPIAGQLDNLKLYFENEEVFFVDQTLTGKIADTETTPGKISVLKSLASRAPPFNAVDPESQSFQVLINDIIRHETTELKTGSHQLACQASYVYFQARHKELSLLLEAAKQFRVDLDDDYLGGEEFNWRKNLFNSDTLNFTAYILAALREGIKIVNKMQDGNITAVAVERHGSLATNTWMLGSDIDGPVFYSDGYIPEASRKLLIYLLKSSGVMGFDKGVLSDDSIEWIVSPGVNAAGINTDKIIIYENG
ncbi:MAG: ribose-phosphate diphosphokinase, partial [Candidatus Omnitrophica bacterium]|nr:ribose-phosphate diphosphokinase [Candidatus Omnitrophota bacterium]